MQPKRSLFEPIRTRTKKRPSILIDQQPIETDNTFAVPSIPALFDAQLFAEIRGGLEALQLFGVLGFLHRGNRLRIGQMAHERDDLFALLFGEALDFFDDVHRVHKRQYR